MLAGSVAGWDATALYFVYPDIRDGLAGGNEAAASWVLSITSIVSAALLLQVGRLGDRYGHRRIYAAGAALYGCSGVFAAVAPGLWWLVGARAFMAAGLALVGPSSIAIILRATPPHRHATAIGRWGMYTAVAGVVGPIVVALLIDSASWRVAFALQAPLGLALWLLSRRPAGIDEPRASSQIHLGDSAIAMVGLVALVLPIVEGNDWGWTSPEVLGSLAVAGGCLMLLLYRSIDSPSAPLPLDLFARRSFSVTLLMSVSGGIMFFAQWLAYLLFLTEVWDFELIEAALVLILMPASMMLFAQPAGRWADLRGYRAVMAPGAGLYAVCAGIFWIGADEHRNIPLLLPALVSAGIAMATIWPTLSTAGNAGVEPHRLGTSTAVIQTVQRVGAVLGIALVVAILAGDADPTTLHLRAVGVMPVAALATMVLALFVEPRPTRATAEGLGNVTR